MSSDAECSCCIYFCGVSSCYFFWSGQVEYSLWKAIARYVIHGINQLLFERKVVYYKSTHLIITIHIKTWKNTQTSLTSVVATGQVTQVLCVWTPNSLALARKTRKFYSKSKCISIFYSSILIMKSAHLKSGATQRQQCVNILVVVVHCMEIKSCI